MEQLLVKAIETENHFLLRQILINVDKLAEIDESFQSIDLQKFYSSFSMVCLQDQSYIPIFGGTLYFFVNKGTFEQDRPESKGRIKKTKIRKKSDVENLSNVSEKNYVNSFTVGNIENWFNSGDRALKYYVASEGSATVLKISFMDIDQKIRNRIKIYFGEKLKMLTRFDIFKNVSKNALQIHLHDFHFLKLTFNEFIYSPNKRSSSIFFLNKGEVELNSNKNKIILKAPTIFGDEKMDVDESAKCLTDYCIVYELKRQMFEEIMKKKIQENEIKCRSTESILRSEYIKCQPSFDERAQTLNRSTFHLSEIKRGPLLEVRQDSCERSNLLRGYFSNFMNEKYYKFYQRKANWMKEMGLQQEELVLYSLKSLTPKSPNYDLLKEKLKLARVKKMAKFKESLGKKSSNSLLNFKHEDEYHHFNPKKLLAKGTLRRKLNLEKLSFRC